MEELSARISRCLRALAEDHLNPKEAAWAIVGYPGATKGIRADLVIFSRRPFPRPKRVEVQARKSAGSGELERTRDLSAEPDAERTTGKLSSISPDAMRLNQSQPHVSERTRVEVEELARLLERAKSFSQLSHAGLAFACARSAEHVRGIEDDDLPSLAHALREIREDDALFEQPLAQRAKRLKLVRSVQRLADTLQLAHESGLVHRHLRPQCIGVRRDGSVTIGGFASALLAARAGDAAASDESSVLTGMMDLIGQTTAMPLTGRARHVSPYMAPECARGEHLTLDERTDVYGLGALLYEIVCGHPPFEFSVATLTLRQILHEAPKDIAISEPDLPHALHALISASMRRDQPARLPSIKAFLRRLATFIDDLEPGEDGKPKRRLPSWVKWTLVVVVSVCVSIGILVLAGVFS